MVWFQSEGEFLISGVNTGQSGMAVSTDRHVRVKGGAVVRGTAAAGVQFYRRNRCHI
jgi:hypothetical protein